MCRRCGLGHSKRACVLGRGVEAPQRSGGTTPRPGACLCIRLEQVGLSAVETVRSSRGDSEWSRQELTTMIADLLGELAYRTGGSVSATARPNGYHVMYSSRVRGRPK